MSKKSNRSNRDANNAVESQSVVANEVGTVEEAGILDPATTGWDSVETSIETSPVLPEEIVVESTEVSEVGTETVVESNEVVVSDEAPEFNASQIELVPGLTPAAALEGLGPAAPAEPVGRKKRASKPGRPYYAAQQLRLAGGVKVEITDELAAKVDVACGKPNKTESLAWLRIAQQICQGWETAKADAEKEVPAAE